jgi:MFS family permease
MVGARLGRRGGGRHDTRPSHAARLTGPTLLPGLRRELALDSVAISKPGAAHGNVLRASAVEPVAAVSGRGLVRWPLIISGIAFLATGVVMLGIVHTSSVWVLILMSLLFGTGNGFSGFANQAVLYVQTPAEEVDVASGLYRTFAYFGAIFSSSLVSIAFGSAATDEGFHVVAWAVVLIGLGVLLLTILDRQIPARTTK